MQTFLKNRYCLQKDSQISSIWGVGFNTFVSHMPSEEGPAAVCDDNSSLPRGNFFWSARYACASPSTSWSDVHHLYSVAPCNIGNTTGTIRVDLPHRSTLSFATLIRVVTHSLQKNSDPDHAARKIALHSWTIRQGIHSCNLSSIYHRTHPTQGLP